MTTPYTPVVANQGTYDHPRDTPSETSLLAQAVAARSDRTSDVDRINAAARALSQISVAPEMSHAEFVASYDSMIAEARALAAELGKALTYTGHHWSGQGEQPLALWTDPSWVGGPHYESIGSVKEILVRLRADVAKKRAQQQLMEAAEAQRQRDREQIAEGRRSAARQVLETSGYADELAAARAENAALRDELAGLRALVLAGHAPQQESAVVPAPVYQPDSPVSSGPGEYPAVVVDEPGDEFSMVAALKAQQAAVLARFRSS